MILTETRLKSLIKEAIKDYIKENITSNKYHFFYIGKDDSLYDGHYQTTIEAKSDKEALKIFLEEFSKIFIANLDDDINKIERYAIGKVNSEDEEDYEIIYDIKLYTKNGRKVEYKYTYTGGDSYEFGDSYEERNKKRFMGYISDVMGRKLCDIPEGYCKSISLIKKFVENYVTKEFKTNNQKSFYTQIYDMKTQEWTEYNCFIFDFGGDIEFSFEKAK